MKKINLIVNMNNTMVGLCFTPETTITIGREIGCTIAPMSSDGLSRRHAKIYFKDNDWYIEDLGSTNGTFHATKKISSPEVLAAKEKLQFGRFELTVDDIFEDAVEEKIVAAVPPVSVETLVEERPLEASIPTKEAGQLVGSAAPSGPQEEKPSSLVGSAAPSGPQPIQETVKPAAPSPLKPAEPLIRKPVIGGGIKPGLKLPTKPALGAGLKLPPKPGFGAGLKLPPKPGLGGLKPGLKLPPKLGGTLAPKRPPAAPVKMKPVADLEPVADLTPISPNE